MTDHYEFANALFYAIVETLNKPEQRAMRKEPPPAPEAERPRVHRKAGGRP